MFNNYSDFFISLCSSQVLNKRTIYFWSAWILSFLVGFPIAETVKH